MGIRMTREELIRAAQEYGLKVDFDKEPGLYIGDRRVEVKDLFGDILEAGLNKPSEITMNSFVSSSKLQRGKEAIQVEMVNKNGLQQNTDK